MHELLTPPGISLPQVNGVFTHLGVAVVVRQVRGDGEGQNQGQRVADPAPAARILDGGQYREQWTACARVVKFCGEAGTRELALELVDQG